MLAAIHAARAMDEGMDLMSKAFQCDRCKRFEQLDPVLNVILKTTDPPIKETKKELCAPCLAGLNEWLDAYEVKEPAV